MNTQDILIQSNGEVDPSMVTLSAGDLVRFQNQAASPAVLTFKSTMLFGDAVFEVDQGATLGLTIQPGIPSDAYFYEAKVKEGAKDGSPCMIIDGCG